MNNFSSFKLKIGRIELKKEPTINIFISNNLLSKVSMKK
jgi:hypothetical protein